MNNIKYKGGSNNRNYYISSNEIISIIEYKKFLNKINKNLKLKNNSYDLDIIKNTDMCNCNIDTLQNIVFLTSASNNIYKAEIKNNCISNSIYFKNNINNVILKVCESFADETDEDFEEANECLYASELVTSILYANLVINNITSNLLLLYGFMTNCELEDGKIKYIRTNSNTSIKTIAVCHKIFKIYIVYTKTIRCIATNYSIK